VCVVEGNGLQRNGHISGEVADGLSGNALGAAKVGQKRKAASERSGFSFFIQPKRE
jgi:hypothetical protein